LRERVIRPQRLEHRAGRHAADRERCGTVEELTAAETAVDVAV
jgi:hypothetical protein